MPPGRACLCLRIACVHTRASCLTLLSAGLSSRVCRSGWVWAGWEKCTDAVVPRCRSVDLPGVAAIVTHATETIPSNNTGKCGHASLTYTWTDYQCSAVPCAIISPPRSSLRKQSRTVIHRLPYLHHSFARTDKLELAGNIKGDHDYHNGASKRYNPHAYRSVGIGDISRFDGLKCQSSFGETFMKTDTCRNSHGEDRQTQLL